MRGSSLLFLALLASASPSFAEDEVEAPADTVEVKPRKPAEVRAEQLDILLARLHKTEGSGREPIEAKIWALWSSSDSPTAEVLLQQAQKAMEAGAPAESMSILDRLVGAHPDFAEAWNKRATLFYLMKRDDASLADIEKVLDLEPRHFGALAGKGMILQRQKKYSAARAAYEDALAINPGIEQVKSAMKELDRLEQGI